MWNTKSSFCLLPTKFQSELPLVIKLTPSLTWTIKSALQRVWLVWILKSVVVFLNLQVLSTLLKWRAKQLLLIAQMEAHSRKLNRIKNMIPKMYRPHSITKVRWDEIKWIKVRLGQCFSTFFSLQNPLGLQKILQNP